MAKKQRPASNAPKDRSFHLEFKNATQKSAWAAFQQNDILFMSGPAGTGKSFLAMAFAINEVLARRKRRIVITRPIVEAGESLGFLPGDADQKVAPYMAPLVESLYKLVGPSGSGLREVIDSCIEVRPLAFQRGVTFDDAVCILDEAQNCIMAQLKLFTTRLGENSKMIITGDPDQSDLPGPIALVDVIDCIGDVEGVGTVAFDSSEIVRHPIIAKILARWPKSR